MAAAEAAGLAAWLWFDLGDTFRMRLFYRQSNDALTGEGDLPLASYIKGYEGLAAAECGRRDAAAALLAEACDRAPTSLSPSTRSWLDALNANILAGKGDDRGALASLDRAQHCHDRAQPGRREPWMFDFDHSSLAGYSGSCHLTLGDKDAAIAAFEEALRHIPQTCDRRRATIQIGLARARLCAGEVDEACTLASAALTTFAQRGSVVGVRRIRRFRGSLWEAGHTAAALAIDEQVRFLRTSNP